MKKARMSGYEKLVKCIEQSTERHPRSKVVIDARTLEVIAVSTNSREIDRKVREEEANGRLLIVSQKKTDNYGFALHTYNP